jgi:hypothetical protein
MQSIYESFELVKLPSEINGAVQYSNVRCHARAIKFIEGVHYEYGYHYVSAPSPCSFVLCENFELLYQYGTLR